MTMLPSILPCLLLASLFAADDPAPADPTAVDLQAIQGRWAAMSWQDDGYDATGQKAGPGFATIAGTTMELATRGRGFKALKIMLDATTTPKSWSMILSHIPNYQGDKSAFREDGTFGPYRGVYQLDGETLRIACYMKGSAHKSYNLENTNDRKGKKEPDEGTDKLYWLMREDGYTAGDQATATGCTIDKDVWTAGEGASISSTATWSRLRCWYAVGDGGSVRIDLGGGTELVLGSVSAGSDKFRFPTATCGKESATGKIRISAATGNLFWGSTDIQRVAGKLRVWICGDWLLDLADPSPASASLRIGLSPGAKLQLVRWLPATTAKP
ncbi:hypothetical protein LBMAG53_24830 [Planctomycetota bacterium]|nr:hypothetical protein LBMAG53_24830 [Planctomycetota bacterium]